MNSKIKNFKCTFFVSACIRALFSLIFFYNQLEYKCTTVDCTRISLDYTFFKYINTFNFLENNLFIIINFFVYSISIKIIILYKKEISFFINIKNAN
jgi:hypothetical protein